MSGIQFILYVSDQVRSAAFYRAVLKQDPILDVPGMTEFQLSETSKLGLMPEAGIRKILRDFVPNPASGNGIPRCELYLDVDTPSEYLQRALKYGATKVDDDRIRDWGDRVAYCADPDGHILAFAKQIQ